MSDPTFRLLLQLAGRVDDDLLATGRELVAVGEEGHALELLVAELVASRTPLPGVVRGALVAEAAARRVQPDADGCLPRADDGVADHGSLDRSAPDGGPHRFTARGPAGRDAAIADALADVPAPHGWSLAWRRTPAGSAPGPLPHPVLLSRAADGDSAEILTYRAQAALGRAGIAASVEVAGSGDPEPGYHRDARDVAEPLPDPAGRGSVAGEPQAQPDGAVPVAGARAGSDGAGPALPRAAGRDLRGAGKTQDTRSGVDAGPSAHVVNAGDAAGHPTPVGDPEDAVEAENSRDGRPAADAASTEDTGTATATATAGTVSTTERTASATEGSAAEGTASAADPIGEDDRSVRTLSPDTAHLVSGVGPWPATAPAEQDAAITEHGPVRSGQEPEPGGPEPDPSHLEPAAAGGERAGPEPGSPHPVPEHPAPPEHETTGRERTGQGSPDTDTDQAPAPPGVSLPTAPTMRIAPVTAASPARHAQDGSPPAPPSAVAGAAPADPPHDPLHPAPRPSPPIRALREATAGAWFVPPSAPDGEIRDDPPGEPVDPVAGAAPAPDGAESVTGAFAAAPAAERNGRPAGPGDEEQWLRHWASGAWTGLGPDDLAPADHRPDAVPDHGVPSATGAEIEAPTPPPGIPIVQAPAPPPDTRRGGRRAGRRPRHLLLADTADRSGPDGTDRTDGPDGTGDSTGGTGTADTAGTAGPAAVRPSPQPRPSGALAERLSSTEQDLLQRLHEELAARENGGEPTPHHGTARTDPA
ncbi:hypothetical protein WIS52_16920 [Pseudonocardia nematodicida]|uniref:Syndecan 1 n=1 Tax=Pseudonocardia nematodicida TaxID=1206997 RepID=A0ABV1KEW4_9PSEU